MSRIQTDTLLGGRYRLLERLAVGGMGSVWDAEDTVLHRRVAVKTLVEALAADPTFVERFRREARAAAGLSHPDVASVFDYGEDGDTPYIVMERLRGRTLAERLTHGPLDLRDAVAIVKDAASALDAAHAAGIVHRDVKPGNIMLTADGGVKVMDFGIAAAASEATLTGTGSTMGTASYLSPEQAQGERATAASDIYSLGAVLFEMLAGRPPFSAETPVAVAAAHVHQAPPDLRSVAPGVPQHVAAACAKALSKAPAARPRSAGEFAAMLTSAAPASADAGAVARSSVGAEPAEAPTSVLPVAAVTSTLPETGAVGPPDGSRRRSHLVAWLLVAGLVVLLAITVVLAHAFGGRSGQAPPAPSPSATASASTKVPAVVGLPVDDAKRMIADAGLTLGPVKPVPGPAGKVVAVHPAEGTLLTPGASVTLDVGAPPKHPKGDHGDHGKGNGGGD